MEPAARSSATSPPLSNKTVTALVQQQKVIAHSITRMVTNYKKDGQSKFSAASAEARIKRLDAEWARFQPLHLELLQLVPAQSQNLLPYFAEDMFDQTQEAYWAAGDFFADVAATCRERSAAAAGPSTASTPEASQDSSVAKLARIPLPKFSGSYPEWQSFRDLFHSLVMTNRSLSDVQRLHYLKTSVEGHAAHLIAHFTLTSVNFEPAWKTLEERYNNKRVVVTELLSSFLSLPALTRESAIELARLRDTTRESLSMLRAIGRSVDTWDDMLVFSIANKLDRESVREWEMSRGASTEPPTFEELDQFLIARIRALEALSTTAESPRTRSTIPRPSPAPAVRAHATTTNSSRCPMCRAKHLLFRCPAFRTLQPVQRREVVTRHGVCFNCLRDGHVAAACPVTLSCTRCGKRHHSSLHTSSTTTELMTAGGGTPPVAPTRETNPTPLVATTASNCALFTSHLEAPGVLLATATVQARSAGGDHVQVRVLLDQGSEATFVSEGLVQLLRLPKTKSITEITGAGGNVIGTSRAKVDLSLRHQGPRSAYTTVRALVLPRLTSYSGIPGFSPSTWPHLRDLPLADEPASASRTIDVLLGADYFGAILLPGLRRAQPQDPIAQKTVFGWVVSGPAARASTSVRALHTRARPSEELDAPDALLRRFWEIEEVSVTSPLSPDDARCEQHFVDTHRRQADGRYIVRLPFREGPPVNVGESRPRALACLRSLDRRLEKDASLRLQYNQFLREYESLGHMRLADSEPSSNLRSKVYLPHHPVLQGGAERVTKLRVVFNASALTSNGTSLNDHLLVGPKLQADLATIILRWRSFRVAVTADIKKMYRQILVDPVDAECQCILWHREPASEPATFVLTTVTYGTAAAPFLAQRVLRQLAADEGGSFTRGREVLLRNFYVDDVLFGADSIAEALTVRDELTSLLDRGGFSLGKWASSATSVLPEGETRDESRSMSPEDAPLHSVLGMRWFQDDDAFSYRVEEPNLQRPTKRSILSVAARLFDPLGFVAPAVITAKILLQSLWIRGVDWDSPLPIELLREWSDYAAELHRLRHVRVPRWYGLSPSSPRCELHGFADASSRAYAAVVYVRILAEGGTTPARVTLVTAKTRVAPVKTISVPRLELCAALLLSRLLTRVLTDTSIQPTSIHAWTDSQVVLEWLRRHPSSWQVFVANRVSEIQTLLPSTSWKHVPTHQNPADCASRGMLPGALLEHLLWWRGPSWLAGPPEHWPPQSQERVSAPEQRRTVAHCAAQIPLSPLEPLPGSIASWPKLLRVTRIILHFVYATRSAEAQIGEGGFNVRAVPEHRRARVFWLRWLQHTAFGGELTRLRRGERLPASSPIARLTPFVDEDGLIRVGGRIHHAPIPFDARHPVILPRHPLVHRVVENAHLRALHGGPLLTLSVLRQLYWLVGARSVVRSVVHRCVICSRYRAARSTQIMADLPPSRVTPSRPFSRVGVDYAGPFPTRVARGRGLRPRKSYVAIFICLVTKAVHLELVSDYTSACFLATLQRFVSRRGRPAEIWSDNGTNFRGADRELRDAIHSAARSDEVASFAHAEEMIWRFIPPNAPHFGGLWEAGVKSVKHHLRRVVREQSLTFEEMHTLLCMIEACLNSRPLTPASNDADDIEVLTPGHFLTGAPLLGLPFRDSDPSAASLLTRWQLVVRMRDHFWRRWQADYLLALQQRYRWAHASRNFRVDDLVVLREDGLPAGLWRLGRVTRVHPGQDGRVRVVTVRTARGELQRPIARLVLLPVEPSSRPPDDAASEHAPSGPTT